MLLEKGIYIKMFYSYMVVPDMNIIFTFITYSHCYIKHFACISFRRYTSIDTYFEAAHNNENIANLCYQ